MKKMMMVAVVSACVGAFATVALAEPQPMMRKGLHKLEEARRILEGASADKGGHRVKAIFHIDQAIAEVKAGIEFDNKH